MWFIFHPGGLKHKISISNEFKFILLIVYFLFAKRTVSRRKLSQYVGMKQAELI